MRIIIDLQGMQSTSSGKRGVGRYTENIVREILTLNQHHEILLALNAALPESIDSIKFKLKNLTSHDNFIIWSNHLGLERRVDGVYDENLFFAEEVLREVFLNSWHPDVVFSTNLQEGLYERGPVTSVKCIKTDAIFITTLHDLVPLYYKNEYLSDPYTGKWYHSKLDYTKKSDYILTVSDSSRSDIVKFLGVPEDRLLVAENGYDLLRFNPEPCEPINSDSVKKKYGLPNRYIFYVGGADKHKNIKNLIFAFSSDPEILSEYDLVLGGSQFADHRDLKSIISGLGLEEKVHTPGFIDESDLPSLYKLSSCFVFPSTHEGFGLPIIEAMACGVPVVGSNTSSIKEIIQCESALFDPRSIKDIASKIHQAIFNNEYRELIIKSGLERATAYSWNGSAKKIMRLFDKIESTLPYKKIDSELPDPICRAINELSKYIDRINNDSVLSIARDLNYTYPAPRKNKLFLDVSSIVIHDDKSGIQRVVRAISAELLKNHNYDVELVYSSPNKPLYRRADAYMHAVYDVDNSGDPEIIDFIKGDILLHLDLHPSVAISHRSIDMDLRNKGVKVYFVVYDILPLLRPELFWYELCAEFANWVESVSLSDGAICISRAVANELKDYISKYGHERLSPFNIGWFHLGADIHSSAPSIGGLDKNSEIILQKIKKSTTFLMVGTIEPRKGHLQTLSAFDTLWAAGLDVTLVIVGRFGWGMQEFNLRLANHPEAGIRLFWLNGISDEYLDKVYSSCSCLIAASEGEGFGLPLIEAAQHGIPLLIRDIPVFREVAGDHAFYFMDDISPAAISDALVSWLSLLSEGKIPSSINMPWLTWRESASQLLSVIERQDWIYSIHTANGLPLGVIQYWDSRRLTWRGFSSPEVGFRWSNDFHPSISLHWAECAYSGKIRLHFGTYGKQSVTIQLNDIECFSQICEGDCEILIPDIKVQPGVNVLRFTLPGSIEPNAQDRRKLAISIKEFEVIRPAFLCVQPREKILHYHKELNFRGFSGAEDNFRWSSSTESFVSFYLESDLHEPTIVVNFRTFGKQTIAVNVNGCSLITGVYEGDTQLGVSVNKLYKGYNFIKFYLPDARIPSETDKRLLGIAFRSLFIDVRSNEGLNH